MDLSAEELAGLAERIDRWFFSPENFNAGERDGNGYFGEIDNVKVRVFYDFLSSAAGSCFGTDRWKIRADCNDTLLGGAQFELRYPQGKITSIPPPPVDPRGSEVVRRAYELAKQRYEVNKDPFRLKDLAHARAVLAIS